MTTHFARGFKYVNGVQHTITGRRNELSSNGHTVYTALMWTDGESSCNCPGWATSKKNPKTCRHSKKVYVGENVVLTGPIVEEGHDYLITRAPRVEAAPKKGRKIVLDD